MPDAWTRSAPRFHLACDECIREGAKNLAVDVAELQYVSSMGLRSFLMIAKTVQSGGGKMMLCGLSAVEHEGTVLWFWVGPHAVYDRLVGKG